jgi:hypothetical protein
VTPDSVITRLREALLEAESERAVEDATAFAGAVLTSSSDVAVAGLSNEIQNEFAKLTTAMHLSRGSVELFKLSGASDIEPLLPKLFLSPEELASNMRARRQVYTAPEGYGSDIESLRSLAFGSVSSTFTSEDDVLRAAKHTAAVSVATNVHIRSSLRQLYFQLAQLSTTPTEKGIETLDSMHPYYGLQFISGKRADDFLTVNVTSSKVADMVDDEHPRRCGSSHESADQHSSCC